MLPESFRRLSDDEWLALLKRSVSEQFIDGVKFPSFPSEEIQTRFVGSAYDKALEEGSAFYRLAKRYAEQLGMPFGPTATALDFGTGWGRYLRFLWRDVPEDRLYGVDVHAAMIDLCKSNSVPGNLCVIEPFGKLPFPDNSITFMMAYSVFTHLPEHLHFHLLSELQRIACPGCVFALTVEPPRFIDFCATTPIVTEWHRALSQHVGDGKALKTKAEQGEYVYIPTGGGEGLPPETYGDSVIPKQYIENNWSKYFNLVEYIDDPSRFWQAVVILQKKFN